MSFLLELVAPLAAALSVPPGALVFVLLILAGTLGHVAIYRSVRRLTMAADKTETRWDDVILYAVFPPIQWVMWTVLALLSLSLFSIFDGERGTFNAVGHGTTDLIWLVGAPIKPRDRRGAVG